MVNDTDNNEPQSEITIHDLKIWTEFYDDVDSGRRLFEMRKNDRDYQVGDVLKLREWLPKIEEYSGAVTYREVLHVFKFAELGSDILTTLGLNPRPSSMSALVILSIGFLQVETSAKITMKEMMDRPLHIEQLGVPDFNSSAILAAHIHKLDVQSTTPDQEALLDAYLITSNTFHPMWTQWLCALVHLRPIEGSKEAVKQYPQAEYEMTVQAIDPETPIDNRNTDLTGVKFLTPIDSTVQFNGIDDNQARSGQAAMMQLIANGQISPDSDFKRIWGQEISRRVLEQKNAH